VIEKRRKNDEKVMKIGTSYRQNDICKCFLPQISQMTQILAALCLCIAQISLDFCG